MSLKIIKQGFWAVVAAMLSTVPLGASSSQSANASSPQQQACTVKCEAEAQDTKELDEEMDETSTPEQILAERRACMIACLGGQTAPSSASVPGGKSQRFSSCGKIVGTWNWPNGSVMAFYKNGTAGTAGQPPGGTWTCSGDTIIAAFNNGGRDQYKVAPDGNTLSFTTNWIPGTYTATRKSWN
jgi:hypothetical protein